MGLDDFRLYIKHILEIHHIRHIERLYHRTAFLIVRHDNDHFFRLRYHACYITDTRRVLTCRFPIHFLIGILRHRTDGIHKSHTRLSIFAAQCHHALGIGIDNCDRSGILRSIRYPRLFVHYFKYQTIVTRDTSDLRIQIFLQTQCIRRSQTTHPISCIHIPQIGIILSFELTGTSCNLRFDFQAGKLFHCRITYFPDGYVIQFDVEVIPLVFQTRSQKTGYKTQQ